MLIERMSCVLHLCGDCELDVQCGGGGRGGGGRGDGDRDHHCWGHEIPNIGLLSGGVVSESIMEQIKATKFSQSVSHPSPNVTLRVYGDTMGVDFDDVVRRMLRALHATEVPLDINLVLTDSRKRLANTVGPVEAMLVDPTYINSGVTITFAHKWPPIIFVYRSHEVIPILLHELIHAIDLDLKAINDGGLLREELVKRRVLAKESTLFLPNEAITDALTIVMMKRVFKDFDAEEQRLHTRRQCAFMLDVCGACNGLSQHRTCTVSYYILRQAIIHLLEQDDVEFERALLTKDYVARTPLILQRLIATVSNDDFWQNLRHSETCPALMHQEWDLGRFI